MAQFDVHRNRGTNRDTIPYVVVVQSALFDGYKRRVVVPLVKKSQLDKIALPRFNPTFNIEGTAVVLHPLELVSVATDKLGKVVHSLAEESQQIIDALDELITRAHG
ncbi:CcdB family protein [Steroidobacter flavus]|uniref:Toxin CcdB n=1 Tax=Steroidobacter flavus TaxID=1842136 RepID=A0ABV8SM67_9GAMM